MFCGNCGTKLPENQDCCFVCGEYAVKKQPVRPQYNLNINSYDSTGQYSSNNVYQNLMNQTGTYTPISYETEYEMKWYKFLINFFLVFSGVLNILVGYMYSTGKFYEITGNVDASIIYSRYENLRTVDTTMGIICIVIGVYLIYVRFLMAGYKKNAPILFIATYVIEIVVSLGYIVMVTERTPIDPMELIDIKDIVGDIVLIILNSIYFYKRKHMFNK